jgi:lipid-A-disaccharide synthase
VGALRFFLIAGEPSGDRLGAALMAGLKTLHPEVSFSGVGGALMAAEGLVSQFPMEELSVMGLVEILPKYFALSRRIRQVAVAVLATRPDALITIDSPDFCLRVAAIVKNVAPQMRTIHYVAPSVWAWRPGRAAKMAGVIDHVLTLLPFEPALMTAAGMTAEFVGHPVVAEALAMPGDLTKSSPLVLALPGSRRGEVLRHMPIFGEVIARVRERHPEAKVALPTVPGVEALVRELSAAWSIRPEIITDPARKRAVFATADVALAASGTVSLELAANVCPMVVAWVMKRAALVDSVTLVNLVSETRVVPEFLGPDCRADKIAPEVLRLLAHPQEQAAAMGLTMERLGKGGEAPGVRAAKSVLAQIKIAI